MFAIIKTGGKQYSVCINDTLRVEKLDAEKDSVFDIKDVLMVKTNTETKLGTPTVPGASVQVRVVEQMRDKKIIVFKKKKRKNYRRKKGHRQELTVLKIEKITA